jgi:hypothetical protein
MLLPPVERSKNPAKQQRTAVPDAKPTSCAPSSSKDGLSPRALGALHGLTTAEGWPLASAAASDDEPVGHARFDPDAVRIGMLL